MDQNTLIPQTGPIINERKRKRSEIEPGFPKTCDICYCVLNREVEYQAHFNGKRHAKELRKKQIQEMLKKEVGGNSGEQTQDLVVIDPITCLRKCSICSIEFQSPMIEWNHMNSRRHIKMVRYKRSVALKKQRPTAQSQLGRCEICAVYYTSLKLKNEHLSGKKHKKLCGRSNVPNEKGLPTKSEEQPPVKKLKLRPVIKPILVAEPPAYELLERQAEEAYENYKSVAYNVSQAEGQALYMKYQDIYKAYEAAYQRHMAHQEDLKITVASITKP